MTVHVDVPLPENSSDIDEGINFSSSAITATVGSVELTQFLIQQN